MSVDEIKAEIRRTTPDERRDIAGFLARLEGVDFAEPRQVAPMDSDVSAAVDGIFETHRELLRRLAQ